MLDTILLTFYIFYSKLFAKNQFVSNKTSQTLSLRWFFNQLLFVMKPTLLAIKTCLSISKAQLLENLLHSLCVYDTFFDSTKIKIWIGIKNWLKGFFSGSLFYVETILTFFIQACTNRKKRLSPKLVNLL